MSVFTIAELIEAGPEVVDHFSDCFFLDSPDGGFSMQWNKRGKPVETRGSNRATPPANYTGPGSPSRVEQMKQFYQGVTAETHRDEGFFPQS